MFQRGLLVLGAGPSTIRLSPPLMIDEEQAELRCRDVLSEPSLPPSHSRIEARMPFPLLLVYRSSPFGRRSEIERCDHLRSLGFSVVASGYRAKGGEVDLIAWEGDVLVFVEVKARQQRRTARRCGRLSKNNNA